MSAFTEIDSLKAGVLVGAEMREIGPFNENHRRAGAYGLAGALSGIGAGGTALYQMKHLVNKKPMNKAALVAAAGLGASSFVLNRIADKHALKANLQLISEHPEYIASHPDFYEKHPELNVKVAAFVPSKADVYKQPGVAGFINKARNFESGNMRSMASQQIADEGIRGIQGAKPMIAKAQSVTTRFSDAAKKKPYVASFDPAFVPNPGKAMMANAQRRQLRLSWVGENQWQKPMLKTRAVATQAVAQTNKGIRGAVASFAGGFQRLPQLAMRFA